MAKKIVLHSLSGYRPELDVLVAQWIQQGVTYIGVVGPEADRIENIIDELCVGDGSNSYSMLTASHPAPESLADAAMLATQLTGEYAGPFEVIEF